MFTVMNKWIAARWPAVGQFCNEMEYHTKTIDFLFYENVYRIEINNDNNNIVLFKMVILQRRYKYLMLFKTYLQPGPLI